MAWHDFSNSLIHSLIIIKPTFVAVVVVVVAAFVAYS